MPKDSLTKEHRSWNMSRIRGKHTTPEKAVRSLLHRMGYRFRLHVRIRIPIKSSSSSFSPSRLQKLHHPHQSKGILGDKTGRQCH